MKHIFKACIVAFIMVLPAAIPNKAEAQVSASISFQAFYDDLSPYGRWIDYPSHGYVWSPADRYAGFHPYRTGGHWAWSDDYGWLWVSDYDWGWAPFHYGRWFYDSYYGWLWVPDYEWAPAWVVWRGGGDYYGWAPMSPGISISLYFGSYSPPGSYWSFAPSRYITSPRISNYYVNTQQNTTIINKTTVINNYSTSRNTFITGPNRSEAERYAGTRIQSVKVRESAKPGRQSVSNTEVSMYRPSIQRSSGKGAPKKAEQYKKNGQNASVVDRNINRPDSRNNREVPSKDIKKNNATIPGRNNEVIKNSEDSRKNERKINPVERNNRTIENKPQRNEPVRNQPNRTTQPVVTPGRPQEPATQRPVNQQREIRQAPVQSQQRPNATKPVVAPGRQQQPATQRPSNQQREIRQVPVQSQQRPNTTRPPQSNKNEKKKDK